MQLNVTVHDCVDRLTSHVFVDITPDMPLGQLQAILVNTVAADVSGADVAIAVDGTAYPGHTPVAQTGLRAGSWIDLLGPTSRPRPVVRTLSSVAQLRVVSGPHAGRTLHAAAGSVQIFGAVPATLIVNPDRSVDVLGPDPGPEPDDDQDDDRPGIDGPRVAGRAVTGTTRVRSGDQVHLGDRIVEVRTGTDDVAAMEFDAAAGAVRYNRPPRFLPPEPPARFRLPPTPEEPQRTRLPWMTTLIPLVFAGVMALALNNPRMLAFGLMSPMMMIANVINSRKQGVLRYRQEVAEHRALTARIEADAEAAVDEERARRLFLYPDPCEVAAIATTPTPRLWERRFGDEHHLVLRCGTADQPSSVELEDPAQLEHRRTVIRDIRDAPAVVDLGTDGVVGVAGEDGRATGLARWWIAQLGALQSPKDLQVYVLSAADHQQQDAAEAWAFAAWLPHTRPLFGQDAMRTVGFGAQALARRIAELQQLIDLRTEAAAQQTRSREPAVVVVLEAAHRLRAMPGVARILADGPAVGVFSLCLGDDARLLPEECATVVDIASPTHLTIRRHRQDPLEGVLPDWVDDDWLDWAARALAPVIDASPQVSDAAIPEASRLLDVLGLEPPTPEDIAGRWLLAPRSTVAAVGESIDGAFSLDLAADGPHALVAGTTGSGKSELLQTLVASLAVSNSPEGMTFVLVDYKGGAAFKDCVDLPHTVGMVTDLDTHLVTRALASLGAELRYREHVLSAAGAKDLEDYIDLIAKRPELPGLPRLAIVIDEFASLARELPDFVTGLVNIAQRGRSLGIHLVLATQRPSGVVSAEIRANTNLRIALRVTDTAESTDVIDAPDSARIGKSTPGRAYVRLGSNSLIPFQAGRVGGRRPSSDAVEDTLDPLVRRVAPADLADPAPRRQAAAKAAGDVERTDLAELVAAIVAAAGRLAIPAPRKPWLPALPTQLTLADLALPECTDVGAPVPYARADLAEQQQQPDLALDLEGEDGHLSIIGAARTGRSTALRTIAAAFALTYPLDQGHVYAIDAGNGGLAPLRDLPQVGAVVTRTQADETVRLMTRLRAELARRQGVLSAAGFGDAGEQRRASPREQRLPRILLLIDSWEGFTSAFEALDGGFVVESAQVLLREGASAGIHLILTGDRQLGSGRIGALVDDKIALRLIERTDYSLFGLNPRSMPDTDAIEAGRGFRAGSGTELQIAVVAPDASGPGQRERLAALAAELRERDREIPRDRGPFSVESMPTDLSYDDLARRVGGPGSDSRLLVGVGGESVEPLGPDPVGGPGAFVIAGPGMSGRSTALLAMVTAGIAAGMEVVAVAPRTSPLRELAGPAVRAVLTSTEITTDELRPLLDTTPGGARVMVAVDDADLLREIEADAWLRTVIPEARERRLLFVIAGSADDLGKGFSGWLVEARKGRQGILIQPGNIVDADLIGGRLRRTDIGLDLPAGRGYFQAPGTATTQIQIAHPTDWEQE